MAFAELATWNEIDLRLGEAKVASSTEREPSQGSVSVETRSGAAKYRALGYLGQFECFFRAIPTWHSLPLGPGTLRRPRLEFAPATTSKVTPRIRLAFWGVLSGSDAQNAVEEHPTSQLSFGWFESRLSAPFG